MRRGEAENQYRFAMDEANLRRVEQLVDRVTALEAEKAQLVAKADTQAQEVHSLRAKVDSVQTTDWKTILSGLGLVAGLAYFLMNASSQADSSFEKDLATVEQRLAAQISGVSAKTSTAKLEERISARIDDVVSRKMFHERSEYGHDGAIALAQRFNALKEDVAGDEGKFETLLASQATHEGKIERSLLLNQKLEDRVSAVEQRAIQNERSIGKVAATATSSFTEVETQLRGLNEVVLVGNSWRDAMLQLIASQAGLAIEDLEIYRSNRIPASAMTMPGQIQSNGH